MTKALLTTFALLILWLNGYAFDRDLNKYEKIGPLVVPLGTNPEEINKQIREFIWDHWQSKRLCYAVVTFYSTEGDESTSHIYIELDERKRWNLNVTIKRKLGDRRGWSDKKYRGRIIHQTDSYRGYAIEKNPRSSRLKIKDESGKLITEW